MSPEPLKSNARAARIQSGIIEGRGVVSLTLARPLLESIMQRANVQVPEDFNRSHLCQLIRLALPEEQERIINHSEEKYPGRIKIVSYVDGVDMGSDALGYDLARRLSPPPPEKLLQALDTDISPVTLELRTFEPVEGQLYIPEMSQLVLRTVVEPPNLAG